MTTPEDTEGKSSDRIALVRGVGGVVGYLKAVVRVHQQFYFWLHISGSVWLVYCQAPPSLTHMFVALHKAVTATLQTNAAVTVLKKDCRVNVLFVLSSESPWEYQLLCPR